MRKSEDIKLTEMVKLHGCSCKMQKRELEELLESTGIMVPPRRNTLLGPGDDAGAVVVQKNFAYVTHLDFFTPIIDDPYLYGKIAVCNAASDVFAKGAIENAGVLVIMGFPLQVPIDTISKILRGIKDFCLEIEASILGGHTIVNPWPIVGAAVTATADPARLVGNSTSKPGDTLILTKPLGTQPSMSALRVLTASNSEFSDVLSSETVENSVKIAIDSMTLPNKHAAEAMIEIGVNASTDVTGFGILGQGEVMAKRSSVNIEFHTLPVIEGTLALSRLFGYGLEEGVSAETSGGLLISVDKNRASSLVASLRRRRIPAYDVGVVRKGTGNACLAKNPKILEVSKLF